MSQPGRSKKMSLFSRSGRSAATGHITAKMVRINLMAKRNFGPNRREVVAGLGAAVFAPAVRGIAAQPPQPLVLRAAASSLALRAGQPETTIWALEGPTPEAGLRFGRGERLEVSFANGLPAPAVRDWRGFDGLAAAEPLTARTRLAGGATETLQLHFRHAGTFLCDPRLL